MSDRRRRTDKDPVYEDDDWQKGFNAYKDNKERLRRKREHTPDMTWDEYLKNANDRARQKRRNEAKEDIPDDEEYAEVMAKYKRDFKLFLEDKEKVPPPKPPWFHSDTGEGKRAGSGDYQAADSEVELTISDNESLGMNSHDLEEMGPPASVPSLASSEKSAKSSQASKASDKEPPVRPTSVKSRSSGSEAKKAEKTVKEDSETQFKAALKERLTR